MSTGLIVVLVLFSVIAVFFIMRAMIKSGNVLKSLVVSALQGVSALFALNIIGAVTGITLSVNAFSMILTAVMGIPGVILLLLTNIIFK